MDPPFHTLFSVPVPHSIVWFSNLDLIMSKRKAINTLFPYAIFLEQRGQQRMVNAILRVARASDSRFSNHGKFMWHHVAPYVSRLFEKRSPPSLNRVIALISPYVPWQGALNNPIAVSRWAAAALTIEYTDEVGENVIDALFQIAFIDFLRPHIPIKVWRLLKWRPSLPPVYCGIQWSGHVNTITHVRKLGDIDLLMSYFLLIWTDRYNILPKSLHEMERSIREDFGGIELVPHREALLERLNRVLRLSEPKTVGMGLGPESPRRQENPLDWLDRILGRFDRRQRRSFIQEARKQYSKLRHVLLEVHRK